MANNIITHNSAMNRYRLKEFRVSVFVMQKSYSLMIFFNFTQGEDIVNIETYLLGRRIRKCVITVKNMK